jgi:hypothetical protein
MAYKDIDKIRDYARKWAAKNREGNREEYNKKASAYQRERRKTKGNADYKKLKDSPGRYNLAKEQIRKWQKNNNDKENERRRNYSEQLRPTYINRLLKSKGFPRNKINNDIADCQKIILKIKRYAK